MGGVRLHSPVKRANRVSYLEPNEAGPWPVRGPSVALCDECESAATDVQTQFLGVKSRFLKNCVWTISR